MTGELCSQPPLGAAAGSTGTQLERGAIRHELAARGGIVPGQEVFQWNVREIRVRVPGIPVGESELCALGHAVHVPGRQKPGRGKGLPIEHRELLKEYGSLAPGPAFSDRPALELTGDGRLVPGLERGEVSAGKQPAMCGPRAVHELLTTVAIDRICDEA